VRCTLAITLFMAFQKYERQTVLSSLPLTMSSSTGTHENLQDLYFQAAQKAVLPIDHSWKESRWPALQSF